MGKKEKLTQLSCLMEKLYKIDAELGGTAKKLQAAKGTQGEFENAFNDCKERMFKIKTAQKSLDEKFAKKGRDKDFIVQDAELRNEINTCQNLLTEMDKILTKQAKNKNMDKTELARRDKQYNLIKGEVFKMMKNRGMNPPEDYELVDDNSDGVQTVEQFKKNVFSDRAGGEGNKGFRKEANDKELQALDDMKRRDAEQDVILENIYDKVDKLHGKAKDMGGKIEHIGVQITDVTKKVDTTQKIMDTQNQRLKDLLTKYRQPSKFCLDVTLVLFLLGLIGVGYKMLSS